MRKFKHSLQGTTVFNHRQALLVECHLSLGVNSGVLIEVAGKKIELRMFIIRNTVLFHKSMLPIRIKHFHWANPHADLQPEFSYHKYMCKLKDVYKWGKCDEALRSMKNAFIDNLHPTWPDLLSRSYQVDSVLSSPRIATVTDPIILHLHTLSQS